MVRLIYNSKNVIGESQLAVGFQRVLLAGTGGQELSLQIIKKGLKTRGSFADNKMLENSLESRNERQ